MTETTSQEQPPVPAWKAVVRPAVDHIAITTGAACLGNSGGAGRGGFAAILQRVDKAGKVVRRRAFSGSETETTNQQMELRALLMGLGKLKNRDMPVVVVSKSQYLLSGIGGDLAKWKAKGWRKADGKTIANAFLWIEIDAALEGLEVIGVWSQKEPGPLVEEAAGLAAKAAQKA